MADADILRSIPHLAPADSVALVRAARLYQEALWIGEIDPNLCWLLLVSTAETIAAQWNKVRIPNVERLREAEPALTQELFLAGGDPLVKHVADKFAPSMRVTKLFVAFLLQFLPDVPMPRPPAVMALEWEPAELEPRIKKVYEYRSKALHEGRPMPLPMCTAAWHTAGYGIAEIGPELASAGYGGTWLTEDIPMRLHTFEYIVRGAVLGWWRSVVPNWTGGANTPGPRTEDAMANCQVPSTFHVYQNRPTNNVRIHRSDCRYCNHGKGTHTGASTVNGTWHGPFGTLVEAEAAAKGTRKRISYCKVCDPKPSHPAIRGTINHRDTS